MAKRKPIGSTMRWNVFFRDGFACRYCGVQAGEEGVELVIDHIVSVADGGNDSFDNLCTACKTCNGGKGAKSLRNIPTSEEVLDRVRQRRQRLSTLRKNIQSVLDAQAAIKQQIVNIKCEAFCVQSVEMEPGEISRVTKLLEEFGPEYIMEWYASAAVNCRNTSKIVPYLCGCARHVREGR